MNKTFYFVATMVIAGLVTAIAIDVWRSHDFVRTHGKEGTLRIGQRYNASRWSEPLPLKKIHVYTATLAPNYQVIVESDQDFNDGQKVFIRYLERGSNADYASRGYFRPVSGGIRLRTEADAAPEKFDAATPLNRVLDKAMGYPAKPAASDLTAASGATNNTPQGYTAFLVGGANDGLPELVWNNSRAGEWVALLFALFLLQAFAINAWTLPWRKYKSPGEDRKFVHPSLKQVEPDAPRPPVARIAFKPKSMQPENPPETDSPGAPETPLKLPRK